MKNLLCLAFVFSVLSVLGQPAEAVEISRAVMQDTNGVARLGTNTLAITNGVLYINGTALSGGGGSTFGASDLTNRVLAIEAALAAGTNLWNSALTNLVALSTNVIIGVTNSIVYVNASGMGGGGGGGGGGVNTNMVIVSGAGQTEVNGTYLWDGANTHGDGVGCFTNTVAPIFIYFRAAWSQWDISDCATYDAYTSDTLIGSGWSNDSPQHGTGGTAYPTTAYGSY